MVSLSITEIGSIVLSMVENVPTAISGTLPSLISNEIYNAENVIGNSIGTDVAETYQPAIISLSASSVVRLMELTGADVNSIKLGDLSISKGGQSNTAITSQSLREDGMEKLNNLGNQMSYYKALG